MIHLHKAMKILINTATTHKGGSIQVAYSFIQECKNKPQHQYIVVLGTLLQQLIHIEEFPSNFIFEKISYRPAQRVLTWKDQAKFLKEIEKKYLPDVVFTTSGPAYWRPQSKHLMGYNLPHYIYKDSPFFKRLSLKERIFWNLKGRLIKHYTKRDADAYVVQTDDVNLRLRNWTSKNDVHTVTNTYGNQYNDPRFSNRFLPEPTSDEFRLLLVSSYYKHKDFEIFNSIVKYFSENEQIRFVLTLPDTIFQSVFSDLAKKFIYNIGPVSPEYCPQLYRECSAVFLPSLLECFSATYAEAMKMKLPIITTDLSFAHTVCGKAALYFTPTDAADAYKNIKQLQKDPSLYESLLINASRELEKFSTASERAASYLEICSKLIS